MNLKQMIFKTMNFNSMKRIVLALMLVCVGMVDFRIEIGGNTRKEKKKCSL